jgi:hypothetical protein
VHDARSELSSDIRQPPRFAEIVKKGIDDRVGVMARGGVNGNARLLVDDEEVVVFVKYIDVDFDRLEERFLRWRDGDLDAVARFELVMGFSLLSVYEYQPLFTEIPLYMRAGNVVQTLDYKYIEPSATIVVGNDVFVSTIPAVPVQIFLRDE